MSEYEDRMNDYTSRQYRLRQEAETRSVIYNLEEAREKVYRLVNNERDSYAKAAMLISEAIAVIQTSQRIRKSYEEMRDSKRREREQRREAAKHRREMAKTSAVTYIAGSETQEKK